jgi:hypothetical protein
MSAQWNRRQALDVSLPPPPVKMLDGKTVFVVY